jgi:hypothetical protein
MRLRLLLSQRDPKTRRAFRARLLRREQRPRRVPVEVAAPTLELSRVEVRMNFLLRGAVPVELIAL